MLPSTRFGDHARFAHPHRQQGLAEGTVDLVSPGMIQILTLEPNLSTAGGFGETLGKIQRRRAAHEIPQQYVQLLLKRWVLFRLDIFGFQLIEGSDERFGDVATSKVPKSPLGIGQTGIGTGRIKKRSGHGQSKTIKLKKYCQNGPVNGQPLN